jgi:hypothetical protein
LPYSPLQSFGSCEEYSTNERKFGGKFSPRGGVLNPLAGINRKVENGQGQRSKRKKEDKKGKAMFCLKKCQAPFLMAHSKILRYSVKCKKAPGTSSALR